jgi:cellulose synthase/poly-beta-1,6-N-acetylglucosamine synthase-like glycosyltransferase
MTTLLNALRTATGFPREQNYARIAGRKPWLFVTMFTMWGLLLYWFHPRLISILEGTDGLFEYLSLGYFIVFVEIAWLYGVYNICIVLFSIIDRKFMPKQEFIYPEDGVMTNEPVAMLYTTCNDFVEASALSCMNLDYKNYKLYLLDDSSKQEYKSKVDEFAARFGDRVQVIRRQDRTGYKAGNLNHALKNYITESLFAIVDADEILPPDFLTRLVPRLMSDPNCGFVQANHVCIKDEKVKLKNDMYLGVDIHWKWYQPLRNRFGFVMFLGHGALLKTSCWKEVNGFPELVSEDLAYAIAIRERGYYGTFVEDVVCKEDFPETVRAFRIRHIKWTRGTCEFLANCMSWLVKSPNISWVEKLDILFPTVNLPMTFFFFIFMINSGIILPLTMGVHQDVTFVLNGSEYAFPMITLPGVFTKLYSWDFFLVTVLTILAPILCFIFALRYQGRRLFQFLCHSTALYATLSPVTTLAVFGYLLTGKARFLVTGDADASMETDSSESRQGLFQRVNKFLSETHPDHRVLQVMEVIAGIAFLTVAIFTFQIAFIGLALGFMMMPFMHNFGWENLLTRVMVWVPFSMILVGISMGGLGMFGVYPVMFGYGFHF